MNEKRDINVLILMLDFKLSKQTRSEACKKQGNNQ